MVELQELDPEDEHSYEKKAMQLLPTEQLEGELTHFCSFPPHQK